MTWPHRMQGLFEGWLNLIMYTSLYACCIPFTSFMVVNINLCHSSFEEMQSWRPFSSKIGLPPPCELISNSSVKHHHSPSIHTFSPPHKKSDIQHQFENSLHLFHIAAAPAITIFSYGSHSGCTKVSSC